MVIRESAGHLQRWISRLAYLVMGLAVLAAGAGILTGWGHAHWTFVTLRGERVLIQGGGVYAHESVSMASQAIGQDFVTLLVAVPLLFVAVRMTSTGSIRGLLLRTGVLAYFAYTYLLMSFGGTYNELFLVYVALFSASGFGFILGLISIDPVRLQSQFSPHFARRTVAWSLVAFGTLLMLLWLGRIVPSLMTGKAPAGLESDTTLFVQAGDLGIIVPAAVVAGILLIRGRASGYLLVAVMLVNASTFGLALLAMAASMTVAGVVAAPAEIVIFSVITVIFLAATVHTLTSVGGRSESMPALVWRPRAAFVRPARQMDTSCIDLYWLPLGTGGRSVRWNGRIFEALMARHEHRTTRELYHSALEVRVPEARFVIEMGPAWGVKTGQLDIACEGAVGSRWLGRSRFFRYEVRRWRNGVIPDVADSVASPQRVSEDVIQARRLLELVPLFPTATWGRDELRTGDMWNSNSLVAWLLARSGHDMDGIGPPPRGRAPGWSGGLIVAARQHSTGRTGFQTKTAGRVRPALEL